MLTGLILISLIGAVFTALEMRKTIHFMDAELLRSENQSTELEIERDTLQSQIDHLHGELLPKMQSQIDDLTVELESKIDMLSFVDNMNQRQALQLRQAESKQDASQEQVDTVLSTIAELRDTLDELEYEIV